MPTANNNKKTNNKNTRSQKPVKKVVNPLMDEVIILVSFAICVIIFLANFGWAGSFGKIIAAFMFGMFGIVEYILPLVAFVMVIFVLSNKSNNIAKIKLIAFIVTIMLVCTFCQLICIKQVPFSSGIDKIYTYSSTTHYGGGLFGAIFFKLFSAFGMVGSYVLTVIFIIIGIVIVTERSFISGVKNRSKKVYDTA